MSPPRLSFADERHLLLRSWQGSGSRIQVVPVGLEFRHFRFERGQAVLDLRRLLLLVLVHLISPYISTSVISCRTWAVVIFCVAFRSRNESVSCFVRSTVPDAALVLSSDVAATPVVATVVATN